ncbi:hypothetical protein BDV18DRAFT_148021 [Aspergillus unguis]
MSKRALDKRDLDLDDTETHPSLPSKRQKAESNDEAQHELETVKTKLKHLKQSADNIWKEVLNAAAETAEWEARALAAELFPAQYERDMKKRFGGMFVGIDLSETRREKARECEEAKRESGKAEARRKELTVQARQRYAEYHGMNAQFGHPGALEEGGWTVLGEDESEKVVETLKYNIHTGRALQKAGYPMRSKQAPKTESGKRVVALDCEFVGAEDPPGSGKFDLNVLGQVCVIDVLTGEVLLDILVEPSHLTLDYRTKFSGLSEWTYHEYRQRNLVVRDAAAARDKVFEIIDRNTIIVGFALHNDFKALSMTHRKVVDPQLLARQATQAKLGPRAPVRTRSLEHMCRDLLKRVVQAKDSFGHECAEDCFAARELALWWFRDENEEGKQIWLSQNVIKTKLWL